MTEIIVPTQSRFRAAVCQLIIVATACIIFLPSLGATRLWDMDEALYSTVAREMFQRGNWIVPWFNGELFPEKPPLMFWTMMAGFPLFGVTEFGVRFFSVLAGVGTALVTYHLGRILFSSRVGLWAAIVTSSTLVFTISARAATVDASLALVTATAMLLFVLGRQDPGETEGRKSLRWAYAVPMYACLGVAVLGKGPVGMLLPIAAMGLYLWITNGWRSLFRSAWQMRPITAMVVIAAVALPWFIEVGRETHGEWPRRFLLDFNLRPFRQPIQNHGAFASILVAVLYYFYHVPGVLFGFFPWSVFLGPTLVETVRRLRSEKAAAGDANRRWRDGCVFASCWFGVWFVFWSLCKTKLPHYLLPAYPALGLLVACWIDRWVGELGGDVPRWGPRNAWIATILAGVGIAVAVPIIAVYLLPGEAWIGLVGLILVLGGGLCWWESVHDRRQRAVRLFAATTVAFLTAAFGFAALGVDRHQNARPMIEAIHADWGTSSGSPPIATYGPFRESTVFYAGYPVTRCRDDGDKQQSARQMLDEFVATHGQCYIVTSEEGCRELTGGQHGVYREVFRQQRFFQSKSREVVVLRAGRSRAGKN
ncbi:MAG: glycosyltransferase family 39 protein [Planctomycetaceae bacterium]|nr:glycosyltransferase family 39 protein [Planctomycetaceae bacterium]